MLTGIGYKNERLLSFSVDLLIVSLVALMSYLIFGVPHFFSYFKELEEAASAINPADYVQLAGEIHGRFERLLLEVGILYWLYESVALVFWGQTVGKKVFRRKLMFLYHGPCHKVLRVLILFTRTAFKVFCVYLMLPVLILGIQFLLSRTNKTLLDRIFLTQIEEALPDYGRKSA